VLHRGHHFMAGEIAFMCMGPQWVESLPHRCLESLASLRALAAHAPQAAHEDSARWVGELFAGGNGSTASARQAVQEAAVLIGIAVANLSVVIDPSLVVVAGALVAEGEPVVAEVQRIVGRVVPAPPQIVVSALGKEAPLWGCVLMAATEARHQVRLRLRRSARASA
jgi:predicted NBD/HSP70 family sugar kinase